LFDSVFNYFIILIPIAIFIGRIVVQARSKLENEHKRPHVIPVHFEDEEETYSEEEVTPGLARKETVQTYAQELQGNLAVQEVRAKNVEAMSAVQPGLQPVSGPARASVSQTRIISSFSRLSPLQQAVVMTEILGTPKGLN
jgi:hypothetical protein